VVELDQEFWRYDAIDICVSVAGSGEKEANEVGKKGGTA